LQDHKTIANRPVTYQDYEHKNVNENKANLYDFSSNQLTEFKSLNSQFKKDLEQKSCCKENLENMNFLKKQNSSQKKNGNCVVLKSSRSQNPSPVGFLESQGVFGAFNPHSDTINEYDYTYIYDTEGKRMPP